MKSLRRLNDMAIDKILVKQRLVLISEYLIELEALSDLPKEEFVKKRKNTGNGSLYQQYFFKK
jgi:hypothetical protein